MFWVARHTAAAYDCSEERSRPDMLSYWGPGRGIPDLRCGRRASLSGALEHAYQSHHLYVGALLHRVIGKAGPCQSGHARQSALHRNYDSQWHLLRNLPDRVASGLGFAEREYLQVVRARLV